MSSTHLLGHTNQNLCFENHMFSENDSLLFIISHLWAKRFVWSTRASLKTAEKHQEIKKVGELFDTVLNIIAVTSHIFDMIFLNCLLLFIYLKAKVNEIWIL